MVTFQQRIILNQLLESIRLKVLNPKALEKFPEHWDGIELREFFFEEAVSLRCNLPKYKKRLSEYRNTRLVEGF